ncbi:hypothetical protein HHO41_04845 [Bacillus sp. DNRA2]|uniref:hypothetical protein n=1 Tax=Bacillus sp. DNRA2 TaxID=2723053 RepID=UPI00145EF8F9|nr:hypothetical protein [Bacillus sp. DNRA2]NMD69608.1 hypothetical protein [Bacillus sp. DNRA2]
MSDKSFEQKVAERLEKQKYSGGADPSINNPARQQPRYMDLAEHGRKMYERIKHKIKR